MRVAVIGAGAVGSLVAGVLASAGHEVTLAGREERDEQGPGILDLRGPDRAVRHVPVTRLAVTSHGLPDVVAGLDVAVLAVKQFDVPATLDLVASRPELPLVTVQNGIGAEDAVLARRPGGPLVAASLTAATELGLDGEAHWLIRGGIGLSPAVPGAADTARNLANAFRAGGLPARLVADAAAMKWSKLLANLIGNATSALLDMDVADIYEDPRLFDVERRQEHEALAVMRALHLRPVSLPGAAVPYLARAFRLPSLVGRLTLQRIVGGARGGKMPSLWVAFRAGREETEVEWLNGAVASAAERTGTAAPVNATLCRLVQEALANPDRRDWFRRSPERLLAALSGRDASVARRPRA